MGKGGGDGEVEGGWLEVGKGGGDGEDKGESEVGKGGRSYPGGKSRKPGDRRSRRS